MSNIERWRRGEKITLMQKAASCSTAAELTGFKNQVVKDGRGTPDELARITRRIYKLQAAGYE